MMKREMMMKMMITRPQSIDLQCFISEEKKKYFYICYTEEARKGVWC